MEPGGVVTADDAGKARRSAPMDEWLGADEPASEDGDADNAERLDGLASYRTMANAEDFSRRRGGAGLLPVRG